MLCLCVISYNGDMSEIPYIRLDVLLQSLAVEKDALVVGAVGAVVDELPEYRAVPREELVESVAGVFDAAIACLGNSASVDEVLGEGAGSLYAVAPRRKLQGVSLASVLRAHRLALSATQSRLAQMADDSGLPLEERLRAMGVIWEVGEWFMVQVARDYEPAQLAESERRGVEKRDFLTRLFQGSLSAAEQQVRSSGLGLPGDQEYQVVLGRGFAPCDWVSGIEGAFSSLHAPALADDVEGGLVGVVPVLESVDAATSRAGGWQELRGGVFALGRPVHMGNLAASLEEARTVLASLEPGIAGCFDVRSRGWRLAVACIPWLGDLLGQSLVEPLHDSHGVGESLLVYVWAFLEHGRSYRDAAQALYVHENTLRNKVAKFEQITGRSLSDIDTCIELMWLRHDMALKGALGVGDSV